MIIPIIVAVILTAIVWFRTSLIAEEVREARRGIHRLADRVGYVMYVEYDGSLQFYSNGKAQPARDTDFRQLQEQFALFLKDAGYKFVPLKTEEVHQGDKHEVKVTPAKFVKSNSRR
jgi:hypothetical protein